MIALAAYTVLLAITLGYVKWTNVLWKRTGDVSIPIGAAILYAWTFLGAWAFIGDAAIGFQAYHIGFTYYYFMERMFPFVLDWNYVIALALYGVFAFAMLGAMHLLLPKGPKFPATRLVLLRELIIAAGLVAMVVSCWAILPVIHQAVAEKRSVYTVLHELTGWRSSVHALGNEAAAVALLLGYAIHLTRRYERAPFDERGALLSGWSYLPAVTLLCAYLAIIGNRHALFGALVLAITYVACVAGRQAWRPLATLIGVGLLALLLGGSVRGMAWSTSGLEEQPQVDPPFTLPAILHVERHPSSAIGKVGEKVFSNEFFCAHFSMYGMLTQHVEPDPGVSFRYLFSSFLPADRRPITAYDHYAASAHLMEGQGYTIHPAAAWYINFGWLGIPLGGAVLGSLWASFFLIRIRFPRPLIHILPWLFAAFLPALVRNGPEAFKALLFEGLVLPLVLLFAASRRT